MSFFSIILFTVAFVLIDEKKPKIEEINPDVEMEQPLLEAVEVPESIYAFNDNPN